MIKIPRHIKPITFQEQQRYWYKLMKAKSYIHSNPLAKGTHYRLLANLNRRKTDNIALFRRHA